MTQLAMAHRGGAPRPASVGTASPVHATDSAAVPIGGPGSIYTSPVSPNVAQDDTSAFRRESARSLSTARYADCRRCEGMNIARVTVSAPGYGCLSSPVALIGQSLCEKCMERPDPVHRRQRRVDRREHRAWGPREEGCLHQQRGALPSAEEPPVA